MSLQLLVRNAIPNSRQTARGLMEDLQKLLGCEVYVTEEGRLKGDRGKWVLKEAAP